MKEAETYADHKHVPVVRHPGGWALAFVHYSADPKKDDDWAETARARGDVEDWEKEMEINFSSIHGVRCFENFSLIANTDDTLEFDETLPLCLCCDFNVEPMCWMIAQVQKDVLCYIDEIWMKEGSVIQHCERFLNKYGDFYGELRIYGDQSGTHRGQQDNQKSNYDIMKIQFQQAPFNIRMKVPSKNPTNVNSVAAMNLRLKDKYGNPRVKIHPYKCPHLIKDLVEVVWEEGSEKTKIKKVRKREKGSYFWRTHAADAAMSIVNREWPTRKELSRQTEAEKEHNRKLDMRRKKRQKRRMIGAFE
jgi:hypothetical protein